jgi:predicted acyltransferase
MALVSRTLNPNRSLGLDLFRGLTMAAMILVSNPGGGPSYSALEHAAWNGWTPTDVIFPSFAFIIGVALMYSLASRRTDSEWQGLSLFDWITPILAIIQYVIKLSVQSGGFAHAPAPALDGYDLFFVVVIALLIVLPQLERRATERGGSRYLKLLHHGFVLFALGFIWNLDPANTTGFRIMGVLQRLGMVYILGGLIILNTRRRGQIMTAAALLLLYWLLMQLVPVPGHGAGVLTMDGNLAAFIDQQLLGRAHLLTPRPLPYWDPEGLLGAIPATATLLLGAIAGAWIREEKPLNARLVVLGIWGVVLVGTGLWLDRWFPINKNLWSPPYVLLTGGIDLLVLGGCLWIAELKGARTVMLPFVVLGANSLLMYLLPSTILHYAANISGGTWNGAPIGSNEALYHRVFATWFDPRNASLAMALAYVVLWMGIAGLLYRRKIFVKI